MYRVLPALLLSVLCLSALPAHAQRVQTRTLTPSNIDSTLVARFQLADTYLRGAQYDRAITLLEDLYAASPSTHVFYEKLKEAYENVKRYDDAVALVDDRIAQLASGDPTVLVADKARLFFLKGDEEGAFALWDEAMIGAGGNQNAYRIIYSSMLQVRLFDRAIAVLEEGRRATRQPTIYQADLARRHLESAQQGLVGADELR